MTPDMQWRDSDPWEPVSRPRTLASLVLEGVLLFIFGGAIIWTLLALAETYR